jgi:geranylgeranyl pyrophosphate synthase
MDTEEQFCNVRSVMTRLVSAQGGLHESASYHLATGGQFLRARVVLQSSRALCLSDNAAVSMAAALEFLHNASLVHDDIQDGDPIRRGKPSVWKKYGVNSAVTLGDFFITLAFAAALEIETSAELKSALLNLMVQRTSETIRSQAHEMDLREGSAVTVSDYENVARGKTGSLLALAVEGPLVLSGARNELCRAANVAFTWFGLAYQIHDDVLDFLFETDQRQRDSLGQVACTNAVLVHCPAPVALRKDLALLTCDQSANNDDRRTHTISNAACSAVRHFFEACERSREAATALQDEIQQVLEEAISATSVSLRKVTNFMQENGVMRRTELARFK